MKKKPEKKIFDEKYGEYFYEIDLKDKNQTSNISPNENSQVPTTLRKMFIDMIKSFNALIERVNQTFFSKSKSKGKADEKLTQELKGVDSCFEQDSSEDEIEDEIVKLYNQLNKATDHEEENQLGTKISELSDRHISMESCFFHHPASKKQPEEQGHSKSHPPKI